VLVLQNLGFERWPIHHYAVVIGVLPPDRLVLRSGTKERVEMTVADFNRTWQRAGSWGLIALSPGNLPQTADPLTYMTAVAAFESTGNAVSATAAYQAALAAWPDNSMVLFALANNHLEQNRPARAEPLYRTLLAADPDHVAAANNLAEALARQGDLARALKVIQTAVHTAEQTRSPLLEIIKHTRQEIEQALQEKNANPF
jgi:predicted Zn-dependent protease